MMNVNRFVVILVYLLETSAVAQVSEELQKQYVNMITEGIALGVPTTVAGKQVK